MVLAGLLEAVLVFSADRRLVFVNQAGEALLGRSRSALWGQEADAIFPTATWLGDLLARATSADEAGLRVVGSLETDEGKTEVTAEVSPLRDRDGRANGTLLTIQDIARRAALRSQDVHRTRLTELASLVANLGHEINNPLSGIRGAAQMLERKLDGDGNLAEYAAMIVRQVDRMAGLVSALMSLEAPVTERRSVNIHRVLNEVIRLTSADADARAISIETSFDPSLPEIEGDPAQLQQLFLNVLKNAVTACADHEGAIRVSTRMMHGRYTAMAARRRYFICVEIADNGPGIPEDVAERIFAPLFSATPGGHGLGLAIAQGIAAAHNGGIVAESDPGAGACFRVTLPTTIDLEEAVAS